MTGYDQIFLAPLDRNIHTAFRLKIMVLLSRYDVVDFNFILTHLGLTKGNLSSHLTKLETGGYIHIEKTFLNKMPHTSIKMTTLGQTRFAEYRRNLANLLNLAP